MFPLVGTGLQESASGQGGMPLIIPDEDLIVDTEEDVLAVVVSQVSDHRATRANPPRVVFPVLETMRGPVRNELHAHWDHPYDPEIGNPYGQPVTEKDRQGMRQYAKQPLVNPKVGGRWVIIGSSLAEYDPNEFFIAARFVLSEKRRRWVDEQFQRRKRYDAERALYRERWPEPLGLWASQLPEGARPVGDMEIHPGMQLLALWGTTTQCSAIEVQEDGRVKIRPHGYDSRWDAVVPRDKLMQYPPHLLKKTHPQARFTRGYSPPL